jgi:hypothetical protein
MDYPLPVNPIKPTALALRLLTDAGAVLSGAIVIAVSFTSAELMFPEVSTVRY